jgi:translation initiation factor 2B subunit (eIF-2B alpha/beta/delta family)
MKTYLTTAIAAFALVFSQPAIAKESDSEFCYNIEEIARSVMSARQSNVSMSKVMKIMAENFPDNMELMRSIVIQAYEKPAYSTAQYQKREIDEYANHWATVCYMAMSGDRK